MTRARAPREFELAFLPRFHPALRCGDKTMTCRSTRKGRKGDTFRVPGSDPTIMGRLTTDPYPVPLGDVALKHYQREGLQHPGEFIAVWNELHPSGYDPDKVQFLHEFEIFGHPEKPIVAWNPDAGDLVGQDGVSMTDAQETKARAYLDRGLIRLVLSQRKPSSQVLVDYYELQPIPGCKQLRKVWVETIMPPGMVVERSTYACDCQKSKGTARTPPGPCSHEFAVRYYRQQARAASTKAVNQVNAPGEAGVGR